MSHASTVLKQDGFLDATQVGLFGVQGRRVQGGVEKWKKIGKLNN